MLWRFPPRYTRGGDWMVALGWYGLAKACEFLDAPLFAAGHVVSGHTLKHLASATAMAWLVIASRCASVGYPLCSAKP